jgi:hypothetical protein
MYDRHDREKAKTDCCGFDQPEHNMLLMDYISEGGIRTLRSREPHLVLSRIHLLPPTKHSQFISKVASANFTRCDDFARRILTVFLLTSLSQNLNADNPVPQNAIDQEDEFSTFWALSVFRELPGPNSCRPRERINEYRVPLSENQWDFMRYCIDGKKPCTARNEIFGPQMRDFTPS